MPVIMNALIAVKDIDKMMEYAERAMPTVLSHGGERLFGGRVSGTLIGEADYNFSAAFRFKSAEALQAWFDSDAYGELHALRDEAADVRFVVLDEM